MKELKKQHLEMLQLLESIEVMLKNGNSIHPNSVIRGAIQTAIGMDVNLDEKQLTFESVVKPVIKWMCENTHPMMTTIITCNTAELLEGQRCLKTNEFVID